MKRLILMCDGTWLPPEGTRPGNVLRLARAVLPRAPDGTLQLLHYQDGSPRLRGDANRDPALVGPAIDRDILAAYQFLLHNHEPGDEIFVFGFSRGATIARCCIGMLRNVWLLQRPHAALAARAYHIYRTCWHADADNVLDFRAAHALPVRVRFLGAFDTVGERGIPLALFPGLEGERYGFHDDVLSRIVENACHALAIDEQRRALAASPWRTRADRTRTEQAWFAGTHLDIGGGYREGGLADQSLAWMMQQAASCGLALDPGCVPDPRAQRDWIDASLAPMGQGLETAPRRLCAVNGDEILHSSAEQRHVQNRHYRPRNLLAILARDEQMRLPI